MSVAAAVRLLLFWSHSPFRAESFNVVSIADGDVTGHYIVNGPSDWWYGPNAFPAITSPIFIEGNNATISRPSTAPSFLFFYVSGGFSALPAGNFPIRNLTLAGGRAQGRQWRQWRERRRWYGRQRRERPH